MLSYQTVSVLAQVRNIVRGSQDALERLYAQHFAGGPVAEAACLAPQQPQSWQQSDCKASRAALLLQLPMVYSVQPCGSAGTHCCCTLCITIQMLLVGATKDPRLHSLSLRYTPEWLQGVLSRMVHHPPASGHSLIGAQHRQHFAATLAASGRHQQQLRHAIGQIVRASSRYIPCSLCLSITIIPAEVFSR
jgi:hypothetical protein